VNTFGVLLTVIAVVAAGACVAINISVGRSPRSPLYLVQASILGVLVALAPIAFVFFFRLSYKACPALNVLGLPWAEPWREIAHWGAGLIWLAATVVLIVALTREPLRRAGIAMLIWSLVSVVPAFFFLFLIVYGDPGAGCVPG